MTDVIDDFVGYFSDTEEETDNIRSADQRRFREDNEEEERWRAKELEQQCNEVMEMLKQGGERRWDDSAAGTDVRVLEDYKKSTLATRRDLRDVNYPTALHILAKDTNKEYSKVPRDVRQKVFRCLLEHRYNNSNAASKPKPEETGKEELILKVAMAYDNDEFVDCVRDCWPEKFPDLLGIQDGEKRNCLHHLFIRRKPSPTQNGQEVKEKFLARVQKLAPQAKAETLAAMDQYGNTPIHYAMNYSQCLGKPDSYVDTVKDMILKGDEVMREKGAFNKKGESPILVCQRTMRIYKERKEELLKQSAQPNTAQKDLPPRKEPENRSGPPDMKDGQLRRHIDGTADNRDSWKVDTAGLDKNLYFDALGNKEADKIIELLDRMSVGGFGETLAYVYLPTVLHSPSSNPSAEPGKKSYQKNPGMAENRSLQENPDVGRTSLVSVFDKLHQLGVRNILRLCVEDREQPSHTDATIEIALQGRESLAPPTEGRSSRPISIENWDWRKPDLSIDVIIFAAPTVEHVNLYWSGNQAVLRAWGCREGIPRLHTTTGGRLKKVTVHAAPGLETRERMDNVLRRFQKELRNNMSAELEVKIKHRMEGLLSKLDANEEATDSASGQVAEQQHVWVKRMEEFRSALNQIPGLTEMKAKRIKVALIDDGVDLSNLDTYNGIVRATGLSYCLPERGSERPWHRSSHGHGTIMANMIVRINPWVSLYIMRVQDGASQDGGRTIYAESAARAIQGAVDLGVNIISMSWTVKQKIASASTPPAVSQTLDENGGDRSNTEAMVIQKLEDAIDAAAKAKILMFCSASDDIQAGAMDTLPYRKQPGYIFRIGAALAQGQRDPNSEDKDNIEYFFPGNQVAEAWNPRSAGTVKYHDGSSVGTALAAGLASLIMWCAAVVRQHYADKTSGLDSRGSNRPLFDGHVKALQDRENMKRGFDNIETKHWPDKKYLPVWDVFGPVADRMNKEKTKDKKMEELESLVTYLYSKIQT
ncbi:hypothetical protein EDB80DRAFT_561533 [Ilyonectria destructans]|nr:hypothetical protein EDB80DRAFT_561533 [Ilyonectria destructans]